ncbi:cupin domain-containing protein [Streptomonospora nanhaiensis]|uniref:Mannose-6-phosphate isomerase-like protein (Cupin superfamily) n=1 Tax=Streptomonospora nanhaiensis TaxID=1323731 RepID=A0A853BM76_9ACTN|nr:cupin domain-containing protein [Streptomonospora nanhaiensis]MBV2363324.1 cupin domain-containing protein [Streptomonospora nanhaiensis]MBX9388535.1 cupin domain-containing protein [Streptomonospora nanhaiensis]NYI95686.1 mannose-6-phosphate isomerase-like protein (cupin superfamily) [Streptomonospora nanhaiensis]
MKTEDAVENPYGVPVVALPDEVESQGYYNTELEVILRGEQTGGRFFMIRQRAMRPEDAPPFHLHTREDEIWLVNSGRFRFWIGGESLATATTYDVGPGAVVYGPRDVAHSFQPLDGAGDVTILWGPADSQSYFLSVGEAEEREDFEHLDRLEAIGVRVLDRAPVDGA